MGNLWEKKAHAVADRLQRLRRKYERQRAEYKTLEEEVQRRRAAWEILFPADDVCHIDCNTGHEDCLKCVVWDARKAIKGGE